MTILEVGTPVIIEGDGENQTGIIAGPLATFVAEDGKSQLAYPVRLDARHRGYIEGRKMFVSVLFCHIEGVRAA